MSLSDWLQKKANATSLEACELALNNFCAAADTNSQYMLHVADVVWKLLLSTTSATGDPAALLAEIRTKLAGLGPERLAVLSNKLLEATSTGSKVESEAGKLVSCWFKAIALNRMEHVQNGRAQHVVRSYEKTFASMGRLLDREVQRSSITVAVCSGF